jgi:hypothetical protein
MGLSLFKNFIHSKFILFYKKINKIALFFFSSSVDYSRDNYYYTVLWKIYIYIYKRN